LPYRYTSRSYQFVVNWKRMDPPCSIAHVFPRSSKRMDPPRSTAALPLALTRRQRNHERVFASGARTKSFRVCFTPRQSSGRSGLDAPPLVIALLPVSVCTVKRLPEGGTNVASHASECGVRDWHTLNTRSGAGTVYE
jgi:hypothetical protein